MESRNNVRVRVWGDYACFSRPEFKVERVSYPVMTPSAARGVLEAIFWKPEIRYEVHRIGVLALGSQTVILRNELKDRQGTKPILVESSRQQRSSLILKGVDYIIEAEVRLRPHAVDPIPKYLDQFNRRLDKGQYHHTPYLGTREFAAHFDRPNGERPQPFDLSIGTMLFDIAFVESAGRDELEFRRPGREKPVRGYAQAIFFDARVKDGWLTVPAEKYKNIYRLEGEHV
ncbi:MAG TPA: type I-C CRISPR-associated protein Cas5 [Sediminispirochaeta sp.]|nr:type I-C CRISPR-associated protein Cas5 [Sediminispirochaeta sp.]